MTCYDPGGNFGIFVVNKWFIVPGLLGFKQSLLASHCLLSISLSLVVSRELGFDGVAVFDKLLEGKD